MAHLWTQLWGMCAGAGRGQALMERVCHGALHLLETHICKNQGTATTEPHAWSPTPSRSSCRGKPGRPP